MDNRHKIEMIKERARCLLIQRHGFAEFMNIREKQILARPIEIQKDLG